MLSLRRRNLRLNRFHLQIRKLAVHDTVCSPEIFGDAGCHFLGALGHGFEAAFLFAIEGGPFVEETVVAEFPAEEVGVFDSFLDLEFEPVAVVLISEEEGCDPDVRDSDRVGTLRGSKERTEKSMDNCTNTWWWI